MSSNETIWAKNDPKWHSNLKMTHSHCVVGPEKVQKDLFHQNWIQFVIKMTLVTIRAARKKIVITPYDPIRSLESRIGPIYDVCLDMVFILLMSGSKKNKRTWLDKTGGPRGHCRGQIVEEIWGRRPKIGFLEVIWPKK